MAMSDLFFPALRFDAACLRPVCCEPPLVIVITRFPGLLLDVVHGQVMRGTIDLALLMEPAWMFDRGSLEELGSHFRRQIGLFPSGHDRLPGWRYKRTRCGADVQSTVTHHPMEGLAYIRHGCGLNPRYRTVPIVWCQLIFSQAGPVYALPRPPSASAPPDPSVSSAGWQDRPGRGRIGTGL